MRSAGHHLFFGVPHSDNTIVLAPDEAHHALSVLRAGPGDQIRIADGTGAIYTCVIETIDTRSCSARIAAKLETAPPHPSIHMFIGMPQRGAFEEALHMLGPLAVTSVTPVACEHCQSRWWDNKWDAHCERFQRIMVASMKQSLSPRMLIVRKPLDFEAAMADAGGSIIYGDSEGQKICALDAVVSQSPRVSCFIGPPGGFSPSELSMLKDRGSYALWMGPYRLRTELAAAILAAAVIQVSH